MPRQPLNKPTQKDISAALDDYAREQRETTAWNAQPVMDVPRNRMASVQSMSELAKSLSRKNTKVR